MAVTDEVEGTVSIPVSEYEALKEAVAKLERENKRLSDELTILLNRLFRKKSERLDPNQLRMFLEELVPPKEEGEVEEVQVPAHTKKRRKGHGRSEFPAHLPLHRLSGIYKRHGFHLPKSTMWEMLAKLDEIVAQPILRQMREELRLSTHLNADETPATVRLEDRKGGLQDLVWVTDLAPFWLGPHAGTLPRSRASQPPHRGPRDPP